MLVSDDGAYPDYNLCCCQWRVFRLKLVTVTVARIQATTCAVEGGAYPGYWAIQRSWIARVNALCNLSCKKSPWKEDGGWGKKSVFASFFG